ncbi:MAG: PAS domain S-box protein [Proteobacteria bacterium]|nr:PAS domain S-box protein [Pseudomonadota bacterium]
MDASDYQKIRQLFDNYIQMYSFRDDLLTTYFSENFTGITGSGDFLVKDREAWIAITRQDFAQVKDPINIELKDVAIQLLADTIAVATSTFIIHLPIEEHVLSRKIARLVLIFRNEPTGWKISHSSISVSFGVAGEDEIYPLKDLEERNRFLEKLVVERTAQLSEANAQLLQTNELLVREIAEHKQLEIANSRLLLRQRAILDNLPMMAWLKDCDSRLEVVNEPYAKACGHTIEECLGKTDFELFPRDMAEEYIAGDSEVCLSGKKKQGETLITTPAGNRWHLYYKTPLFDEQGEVVGTTGIAQDITDRKKAEEQTVDAMNYIQTILSTSPVGIGTYKATGEYVSANEAATKIVGGSTEQLMQQNFRNIESWQRFGLLDFAEKALRTGIEQRGDFHIVTTFGKEVDIDVLFVPFIFSGEQHLMHAIMDITERKRTEAQLSYSISLTNAALESTADGILIVDRNGMIVRWNQKFISLWNVPKELLVKGAIRPVIKYVTAQMAQPDEFFAKVMQLYEHPEKTSRDLLNLADGRLFDRYSQPLKIGDEIVGRFWSFRDITEQKKHENEQMQIDKLESLGLLAGGIAHDFNNILTGIMGNVSFAQIFIDPSHKSYKPLVEAEKASVRATELAHQLLTFARGGEPIRKVISFQNIVKETVDLALRGTNVKGVIEISDSVDAIDADEGQMSQVLHNLIINASQAMPGGGTLTATAQNETLDDNNALSLPSGRYVRLTVSDQGCGMPDEVMKKIFDPYFTTKPAGNGLGLASVHSVINRHGGHIGARSTVGKGTTFTIHLPSIGETYSKYQTSSTSRNTGCHSGGSILVMDDEEMIRDMTSEILEYLGYQVTTCVNGAEAVSRYKAARESGEPFLAVIMDLTIPGGMGGKEAAQQILAIDSTACLIVSSGYSNDPIMSDYVAYGFTAAVAKPYNIEEFGQLLSEVLSAQLTIKVGSFHLHHSE